MKKLTSFVICGALCLLVNTGCPESTKPGIEVNQAPKYPKSKRAKEGYQPGGPLGGKKEVGKK